MLLLDSQSVHTFRDLEPDKSTVAESCNLLTIEKYFGYADRIVPFLIDIYKALARRLSDRCRRVVGQQAEIDFDGSRYNDRLAVLRAGLDVMVSPLLRRTLATTNPIESAFSVVERICSRVKCWRRGDHIERWVGSALWVAEKNFRRVKGYKNLPKLLRALKELRPESAASRSKAA